MALITIHKQRTPFSNVCMYVYKEFVEINKNRQSPIERIGKGYEETDHRKGCTYVLKRWKNFNLIYMREIQYKTVMRCHFSDFNKF